MKRTGALWLALALAATARGEASEPTRMDWPAWGGDHGGGKYSTAAEITPENVAQLEVVWSYRTGDFLTKDGSPRGGVPPKGKGKTSFQATPVLDAESRTLYFCSPLNRVFALDAETGLERWVFDPESRDRDWNKRCRGVALWEDPAADAVPCAKRVFASTLDARLIAIDAATGERCADFGTNGEVDLRRGVGEHPPTEYRPTSTPTVIGDVVAVGAAVADGRRLLVPAGVIRGFDARTGALRWAFDPVPPDSPEFPPLPPGPDGSPRWHPGTPNVWGVMSADPERDLLLLPMGNPSPDFYRGDGTRPGLDHYGSAVVALRGSTGEVVWSFQTVHHDLWDYDVSAPPSVIEVEKDGRRRAAVAQATKMGFLFVLDLETGEPLWPVEERAVPQGGAAGEHLAPTQPFPTHPPPLHPLTLTPDEAWGLTPLDRGWCREEIERLRSDGIYTPPTVVGTVEYPGVAGGTNWGGIAFDPVRQIAVMNQSRMPNTIRLVPRAEATDVEEDPPFTLVFLQEGTPYALEQGVLVSPLGIPCSPPPWGTLLAVDLRRGEKLWEIPFGTTRGNAPWPFWLPLGMPSMGGPIVTVSGLAFIGAAMDGYLRAYDTTNGEELWRHHLPAGGQATPMTFRLEGGRQLVVIAAGGHGTLGTEAGDWVLAFGLPSSAK